MTHKPSLVYRMLLVAPRGTAAFRGREVHGHLHHYCRCRTLVRVAVLVFLSILLIAACGLIYELIAGTVASYLVGDSVFQFSAVIGCYLFAMGIGSFMSRFIHRGLAYRFVWIDLMVAVVGGFSSSLLFLAFAFTHGFQAILYLTGMWTGML